MKNNISIYTLSNPYTKEVRYVGMTSKTLNERLIKHVSDKKGTRKCMWIKSLKNKGLVPEIDLIELASKDNWIEKEVFWIGYLKFLGCRLTNMTEGGENVEMTQEIRNKISAKSKLFKATDEQKITYSIAAKLRGLRLKGVKQSPELIMKRAKALTGVKKSKSHINNIIKTRVRKPVIQMEKNGDVIKIWESVNECFIKNKWSRHNIINSCNKVQKYAYGFIWKFKNK